MRWLLSPKCTFTFLLRSKEMMRSEDAGDEESKNSGRTRREWEVVEVGAVIAEDIFADDEAAGGKTKSWFKGLLGKMSNKKQLEKKERSEFGWEQFDLEEINSARL